VSRWMNNTLTARTGTVGFDLQTTCPFGTKLQARPSMSRYTRQCINV